MSDTLRACFGRADRGFFVSFEGVEGSGKSSVLNIIEHRLRSAGAAVVATREPGGTELGERLRRLLLDPATGDLDGCTEALLFSAARSDHTRRVIQPALEAGSIVLCDRYSDSTAAYQSAGRSAPRGITATLAPIAQNGLWPDLTFFLDVPPEVGLRRALGWSGSLDRIESEGVSFFERVRAEYLNLASEYGHRFVLIDAARPLNDVVDAVYDKLLSCDYFSCEPD